MRSTVIRRSRRRNKAGAMVSRLFWLRGPIGAPLAASPEAATAVTTKAGLAGGENTLHLAKAARANTPNALDRLPEMPGSMMRVVPDENDIKSEPASTAMNSSDTATIASRRRRRPATRSALHVLTVCTMAESASTSATSDSNREPALASVGQAVHPKDTDNPIPITISHKAPCQYRRTKSSSKAARAQSQNKTGLPASIGKGHHSVVFGT